MIRNVLAVLVVIATWSQWNDYPLVPPDFGILSRGLQVAVAIPAICRSCSIPRTRNVRSWRRVRGAIV